MSFQPPILDDRTFQQIVDEVRKRIPLYCPEWTDHNLSDPGITLIELFAWMTELLIYRLNQVPQLHYIKFAEFLGLQRQSPRAATTKITFWLTRDWTPFTDPDDSGQKIAEYTEVSTTQTVTEPPIIFTTEESFVIRAPRFQQMLVEKSNTNLRPLAPPEVQNLRDGRDSLVMFPDKPQVDDAVYFGFANDLSDHVIRFDLRFTEKAGIGINIKYPPYFWEVYSAKGLWEPVDAEPDTTRGLNAANGSVTLHLPKLHSWQPTLEPTTRRETPNPYWIRIRIKSIAGSEAEAGMREYNESPELKQIVQIATIGCSIQASNCYVVKDEKLGVSDGSPGQHFQLSGKPVLLPLQNKERLKMQWDATQLDHWECQPDFSQSAANARHFLIDSHSGELRFGPAVRQPNGEIRCYGAIPPRGAALTLERYRHGGGANGNLRKKVINVLRSSIPYVASVENRQPATGGLDAPGMEELAFMVQRHLRTHRAAVTPEDFEAHVMEEFGNEVALVRCVAYGEDEPAEKLEARILILIVPMIRRNGEPTLDSFLSNDLLDIRIDLRDRILNYLQEFRLLTDRVAVEKPRYQRVQVALRIKPRRGVDWEPLRQQILRRLYAFFHPVSGGLNGRGWHAQASLSFSDVEQALEKLSSDIVQLEVRELIVGEKPPLTSRDESIKLVETEMLVADEEHDIQRDDEP